MCRFLEAALFNGEKWLFKSTLKKGLTGGNCNAGNSSVGSPPMAESGLQGGGPPFASVQHTAANAMGTATLEADVSAWISLLVLASSTITHSLSGTAQLDTAWLCTAQLDTVQLSLSPTQLSRFPCCPAPSWAFTFIWSLLLPGAYGP